MGCVNRYMLFILLDIFYIKMGLDISYYSNIKRQKGGSIKTKYNRGFKYQLGLLRGSYEVSEKSESYGFPCGAYSTYNEWRNHLAIMAGYGSANNVWNDKTFDPSIKYTNPRLLKLKKLKGEEIDIIEITPFYELISFSDCEGVIGPEISEKLYKDFVKFEDKAKEEDEYFYRKYKDWMKAFKVASNMGAVSFH